MPDLRAVVIAIGVGAGVGGYTIFWWHWPQALGLGAAILLGGLALTGSISVRREGSAADAAWRAAAPDLQDPPAQPLPGVPVRRPASGPKAAATGDRPDLPSGD
ncbi:MAG: hypothetical protein AB1736_04165 [Chloroflexota bacterium]